MKDHFEAELVAISCDFPRCYAVAQQWSSPEAWNAEKLDMPHGVASNDEGWKIGRVYKQRPGEVASKRFDLNLCPQHAHLAETVVIAGVVADRLVEQREEVIDD